MDTFVVWCPPHQHRCLDGKVIGPGGRPPYPLPLPWGEGGWSPTTNTSTVPATWDTAGNWELACGRQAFIATWLFDPSMSALPIILKQNSVSVGLFTLLRERELG